MTAAALLFLAVPASAGFAQSNPEPVESATLPPPDTVESGQLTPLGPVETAPLSPPSGSGETAAPAPDLPAGGLGTGIWQGITGADAGVLLGKTELPLRSPVLAALWRRLMLTEEAPAGADPAQFLALRLDGLYRAGLLKDAAQLLARLPKTADPYEQVAGARVLMAMGDDEKACARVRTLPISGGPLKGRARNDALLMVAY